MESLDDGTSSSEILYSSSPSTPNTYRPTRSPSTSENASSASSGTALGHGVKTLQVQHQVSFEYNRDQLHNMPNVCSTQQLHKSNKGKSELVVPDEIVDVDSVMDYKDCVDDTDNDEVGGFIESENLVPDSCNEDVEELNDKFTSQAGISDEKSPQNSLYEITLYMEAKRSFAEASVSLNESSSAIDKSIENGESSIVSDLVESRKTSVYRGSTGSDVSDESSSSILSSTMYKPHKANDARWEAIRVVRAHDGALGFNHFRLLSRLGCGDIGSVYLSELSGTKSYFAMKVMDKAALASRKKLLRAQTEREILQCLDHPFLPTLYLHFETEKFSCLVMEYCPGGDLHAIRQKQPGKYFPECAARFYVAEVLLAMEYLHMLGIIYRDLKPENVLVREDGHIMLSDFDLSLRCAVNPTLVKSSNSNTESSAYCVQPSCTIQPACIQPTCFAPRFFSSKPKKLKKEKKQKSIVCNQVGLLPELMAEPTSVRSMSFVGTHEYLAPEIIKGEGHGSAVDWWTFGIFLYELLFGRTPFKGKENRATLFNVVGETLKFPETPSVSFAAMNLIRGLLVKEPQHRLAYRRGATEIKQHPFFQNINWALIRCASPPDVPKPVSIESLVASNDVPKTAVTVNVPPGNDMKPSGNYVEMEFF